MTAFFQLIASFWRGLIDMFSRYPLEINGVYVSYISLVLAALVVGLVITVFWKGART